jgi:hypothetical protein
MEHRTRARRADRRATRARVGIAGLPLAVGRKNAPVLTLEVLERRLGMSQPAEDRICGGVGCEHERPVRVLLGDDVLAGDISGERHVRALHPYGVCRPDLGEALEHPQRRATREGVGPAGGARP